MCKFCVLTTRKCLNLNGTCTCVGSGSGKTLAYLAPLVSQLRREEEEEGVVPRLRRPRALIVLPSRDLASQVLVNVCMYM